MTKIIKDILFYIIDFLFEVWESIEAAFTNYKKKKNRVEGYIFFILSDIFFYNSDYKQKQDNPKRDYSDQQYKYSQIKNRVKLVKSYFIRGWGSSLEYGGMVYRWFMNKFDINEFSRRIDKGDSPITKEEILDKKLLDKRLEKTRVW